MDESRRTKLVQSVSAVHHAASVHSDTGHDHQGGTSMGMLDRLKSAAVTTAKASARPGSTGISQEFAIVDVETTGLDPRIHRIIEVAVVVTDARGNLRDEFCTLVQPEGVSAEEARAKQVHLIEADWLKAAPPTSAVLVEVAHRLNGRVVVAHNAMFDVEFLQQEFKRCLHYTDDDLGDWRTLCTVDLCRVVDIPRKLDRACFELGIRDTRSTAPSATAKPLRICSTPS